MTVDVAACEAGAVVGTVGTDTPEAELPVGTVTLLLADIEDSTALWEHRRADMPAALAEIDAAVNAAVGTHHGARPVEQGEGDSFVAAFARPSDAVACALAVQRSTASGFLRLRMGLHSGEVQLRDPGNYIGPTVNRAARLRDAAHGRQVLLSQAVVELVRDTIPDGASLRDLGSVSLRGVETPERVSQLEHPAFPSAFPPLRTTDTTRTNLPAQLTSFVGRSADIEHADAALDEARAITLTGSGGAGKTRLAVEVAARRLDRHPDGVWFADLSRYNEAETALAGVGEAVGFVRSRGITYQALAGFLGENDVLLVLDNCEHLITFAAEVADVLLRGCSKLTMLATSREPLGVAGEVTFRVPSLAVPAVAAAPEEAAVFDAIALFADRARRAKPDFALGSDNTAAVIEICGRLDGLPLAIELAAARLRALSPAQILDGLHDRFRLLTGGARTTIARQQTLHASVDWSYSLLLDVERTVLDRLSVFAGGLKLAAAEAVCAGGAVERHHVLDIVLHLVDKSLVNADGERFHLLETVRQYAAARLVDSGEAAAVRARHYEHFTGVVSAHAPFGTTEASYRQVINDEYENVRRALQWAADQPDRALLAKLTSRLYRYWSASRRMSEGARWYALVADREDEPVRKGTALSRLGRLRSLSGEPSVDVSEKGLALLRPAGDGNALASALLAVAATRPTAALLDELDGLAAELEGGWMEGWAQLARGLWTLGVDADEALVHLDEAHRLAHDAGDLWLERNAALWIAYRLSAVGDLREARAAMEASAASARDAGDGPLLGASLMFAAVLCQNTGDRAGADETLRELEALGDEIVVAGRYSSVLLSKAFVTGARGEWDACMAFLAEWAAAAELADNAGVPLRILAVVEALVGRHAESARHNAQASHATEGDVPNFLAMFPAALAPAITARAGGDWAAAEEAAHAAVDELRRSTSALMYHMVVPVLASVWAGRGRHDDAVRLFAATRADGENKGMVWDNALLAAAEGGAVEACRDALGSARFDELWAEGTAMTWDELMAFAQRGWGMRDRPVSGWSALTPTERQVAELVASGATNKEAAEKLFMSVATVKTHLTRVYSKVGVTSRTQLAAATRE